MPRPQQDWEQQYLTKVRWNGKSSNRKLPHQSWTRDCTRSQVRSKGNGYKWTVGYSWGVAVQRSGNFHPQDPKRIRSVVYNVVVQVILDALHKYEIGETCKTLDAYNAKFLDTDATTKASLKKMIPWSSPMEPTATFVRSKMIQKWERRSTVPLLRERSWSIERRRLMTLGNHHQSNPTPGMT